MNIPNRAKLATIATSAGVGFGIGATVTAVRLAQSLHQQWSRNRKFRAEQAAAVAQFTEWVDSLLAADDDYYSRVCVGRPPSHGSVTLDQRGELAIGLYWDAVMAEFMDMNQHYVQQLGKAEEDDDRRQPILKALLANEHELVAPHAVARKAFKEADLDIDELREEYQRSLQAELNERDADFQAARHRMHQELADIARSTGIRLSPPPSQ